MNAVTTVSASSDTRPIELVIRPRDGDAFESSQFSELASELNLGDAKIGPKTWRLAYCLRCDDTRDAIAEFTPIKGQQFGIFTEVRVSLDPATCAPILSAASQFGRAVARFVEGMDGVLQDAAGNQVTADQLAAIQDQIWEAIDRRRTEAEAAATTQIGPHTQRIAGALPYQHWIVTTNGRRSTKRPVYFDTPALPHFAGAVEGCRMARQMVEYLKTHRTTDASFCQTVIAAAAIVTREAEATGDGQRHAAQAFLDCITAMFKSAAALHSVASIDEQIERFEQADARERPAREAKRAAFVERMRDARARKAVAA